MHLQVLKILSYLYKMIKDHKTCHTNHYFKILKIQPIKTLQISLKLSNNYYVTTLNILSQISESYHLYCFHNFVLSLIFMLTCKLFQNFVVLARIFRLWNYSLSVSSLLLNSSRVLISSFSFLKCSASNVSNLMLLDAWSIIFHLNSDLPLSLPHCLKCCPTGVSPFRCSSILVVRFRTIWPT